MKNREWYIEEQPDGDGDWEVRETHQRDQYILVACGLTKETALLIAGAPKMLEALKEIKAGPSFRAWDMVAAAIAKAEGSPPSTPAA